MALSVSPVNYANQIANVKNSNSIGKVAFKANLEEQPDTLELSTKKDLTVEDKQNIVKKARTKAAGWSCFGGFCSALYYGLRSDEKIARKFELDPVEDKKLVKQIKQDQTIYALTGLIGYFVAKSQDAEDLPVA